MSPRKRNVRTSSRKRKVTQDTPATVVGVGASAGGLEAFRSLLNAVPDNTGMAFVLIQHMDPAQESHLKELLSRETKMSVEQVADGVELRANHVYVIPPNTHMIIRDGALRLVAYGDSQTRHNPIDHFFESLAEDRGGNAIGVVLSGTASDGTRGLKAIKAAGGITFAQDEKSAGYHGMPHSAIAAGCVDFVLNPKQIAAELVRLSQQPYVRRVDAATEITSAGAEDGDLEKIYDLVRKARGIDLGDYKPPTIARRISRRMTLRKTENLAKYLRYLQKNPSELDELCKDIFIHVTGFFRDRASFEALRAKVFPSLIRPGKGGRIRVWCPGCSSGEELYSIAILLMENLESGTRTDQIQLFGTDISAAAIDRARAGLYPESIEADVSPERLKRFFVKTETGYQISKALRDLCVFAEHDLAKHPPFSKIDLISCRNVLIYLGAPLQKRILSLFHYALNPNGFLLLGPSESIQANGDLFTLIDRKHKIYARKPSAGRQVTEPVFPGHKPATVPSRARKLEGAAFDLRREAERIILEQFAPAGLVVDGDLQILQFHGDISPFLAPSAGDVAFHLMKMLRPDLSLEIRSAIHQAQKKKNHIRREGITIEEHGRSWNVGFTVIPIKGPAAAPDFLVLFEKTLVEAQPSAALPGKGVKAANRGQMAALKRELAATQHRLRSIIDDQQTTYEELKAANEEILSSNEELHSTNEELETAKEELQSANEELTTVNDELNNRNAYLDALNNDLNNVLAGIEIPVLLLQKDHRVRRFTPAAGKVLNLIPGDLGRPIGDIRFKIDMPDLDELIEETVRELRIIRREVRDRDGKWYLLSIRPYRTADDKITGTLLALLDIDEFKKAVTLAEDARDYAEAITETVREPLVVLDPKLRIVSANSSFHRAFGYSPADTRDQMFFDLSGGAWNAPKLRELLLDILPKSNELSDFEVEQVFPKTGERRLLLNARQIYRKGVGSQFILLAIEDVTDRRNAEEALIERERTIRALLNSTSQAILAVDGEGKISFHNLGAEHMFGYSSSELMNMLVEELIPERHRAAHVTHRAKYLAAPKVRAMGTGLELMGRRKDGTEFPIDVGLSSVDNSHGPMAVAFVEDITSLQKATTELRALTARLISVQESNNRVLARELHDDFTQKLAALSMDVTTLANQQPTSADALRKSLSHMAEQLGKTAADIHQFSRQIHPSVLEDLGLPAALKAECAAFSEQHTTGCEFIAESVPALIPEDIALCLYRIAQEALRNVGKHSEAERVEVRLTGHDDEVELAVVDFGNGFDLDKVKTEKGLGLVSMEERARMVNGEFSITSQEGQGTSVVVRVPLSRS